MFYLIGIIAIGGIIWYVRRLTAVRRLMAESTMTAGDFVPPCDHKSPTCHHHNAIGEPIAPVSTAPSFINVNGCAKPAEDVMPQAEVEPEAPIIVAAVEPVKRKPRAKKKKVDSWDWPKSPEEKTAAPSKPRKVAAPKDDKSVTPAKQRKRK